MTILEIIGAVAVVGGVTALGTWLDRKLRSDVDAPRHKHRKGDTAETAIALASSAALEGLKRGRCRCGRRCDAVIAEARLGPQTVMTLTYRCGRCDGHRVRYYRFGHR